MGTEEPPEEPPVEPPPPEPEAVADDPFLDKPVQIDAPMDAKRRPTLGATVQLPGEAETAGTAATGRTVVPGQHNWVPIGPRNVGGRVRAIAIEPTNRQIMYAAPASGGVYKSLDGAESWFPLWHDEPSLSMSSISICAGTPSVVWAATGEVGDGRADGAPLPTAGVLRSADSGATWKEPNGGQHIRGVTLHAVAAHPTDVKVAFAVGPDGVYRTLDEGKTWTQFAANRAFSDVAYARFGATLRLFLVLSGSALVAGPPGPPQSDRGVIVRLDNPGDTDANIAAILPAGPPPGGVGTDPLLLNAGVTPPPAAGAAAPRDGKLAIFEDAAGAGANAVAFVAFADTAGHAHGVYRCQNPNAAPATGMTFTALVSAASFAEEEQGDYNLAVAVDPTNANNLAFGMQVGLYVNRNANGASAAGDWLLAQMQDLSLFDRAHHADHHALVFAQIPAAPFDGGAPAATIQLWDCNDGGISVSQDWSTGASYVATPLPADLPAAALPLAAGAMTWRKRSHGISGTQMYDVVQHPRLPAVLGCGFQDNGCWVGTGGPSWEFIQPADGAFVAFDPDDPYRLLATWQDGITDARFPGILRDALPTLRDGVLNGFWPRDLTDGFLTCDRPEFLAPTYFHPSKPGLAFHSRRNRLYATRATTGDRWQRVPVGPGIEILHEPTTRNPTSSSLEVLDTKGGRMLGFVPQRNTTATAEDDRVVSRVRSLVGEPFAIPNGEQLRLSFSDSTAATVRTITVPLTVGADLPASATAAELARYLEPRIAAQINTTAPPRNRPTVTVAPVLWPRDPSVMIVSNDTGAARRITLAGDAVPLLGAVARDYMGADAQGPAAAVRRGTEPLPAMAELRITTFSGDQPGFDVDLSGKHLEVSREGGANHVPIDFSAEAPDPTKVRIGDLVDILRDKLPPAAYVVLRGAARWGIRITRTAGGNIALDGDFEPDLAADDGLDPAAPGATRRISRRNRFDLTPTAPPAARTLRVAEGTHRTAMQNLDGPFLGGLPDLTAVTSVELCRAIRAMLTARPAVRARCDLDLHPDHPLSFDFSFEGVVREVAFGPAGSKVIWAGDEAGRLYRSTDDGDRWSAVPSFPPSDRFGSVEALAVSPATPDTVLAGVFESGTFDPAVAMLFRTVNAGRDWAPVGDGIELRNGRRVGVSSLVIDPAAPTNVFVGTEFGVFRSTDLGSTFSEFSEGLPNAPVVDLAFEPTTRMLRVGLWGRGVYERHVGDRPSKDVRLHIRSTQLDDGTAQPYPGPDLLALTPTPLRLDATPDVKQTRRDPRRGLLLDGVEFDDELRHEDVREGPAFICVQVHNRGAKSTSTARVVVLWAPADSGPPPLPEGLKDSLDAGPLAANAAFGAWKVIADATLPDPQAIGHAIVAPGYPRILVVGAPPNPFAWTAADLAGHRRVGLLALCRCDEDSLSIAGTDVLDLVRTEAKAAYRECAVVTPAEDGRIVIRATGTKGFRIQAPTGGGVANLANGAAPLGLAVAPPGSLEAPFGQPEPYNLGALGGFRLTIDHDITITFNTDERIANQRRATGDEVVAIINRELAADAVPVRASAGSFPAAPGRPPALFLDRLGTATFSAAGTAAAEFGVTVGQGATRSSTPFGSRGPWDLRPIPTPKTLRIVARTPVEIRLGPGIPGLPSPATATAAEVRAAINRQLVIGSAAGVEAAPRRPAFAMRRSVSEAAASRVITGSYALAEIVATTAQIPAAGDRAARLRAIAAHDRDTVAASTRNFLYTRVANVGTVRGAPARVRIFEIGTAAAPLPVATPPTANATPTLAVGDSTIVEIPFDLDARPSGARVFALAVVDTAADPLEPPPTFTSLDEAHRFCLDHAGAAIRELVVA